MKVQSFLWSLLAVALTLAAAVLVLPTPADAQSAPLRPATPVCANGVLSGSDLCVIEGPAPVQQPGTCEVSSVVFYDNGSCYSLATRASDTSGACTGSYIPIGTVCKMPNPYSDPVAAANWTCPSVVGATPVPGNVMNVAGEDVIGECSYQPPTITGACPANSNDVNGECRREVLVKPGSATCPDPFSAVGGKCVRFEAPVADCGKIIVFVFDDANNDGVFSSEPLVSGVTVDLLRANNGVVENAPYVTGTTSAGNVVLSCLEAGNYIVSIPDPTLTFTVQDAGTDDDVDSDIDPTTGQSAAVFVAGDGDAAVGVGVLGQSTTPSTIDLVSTTIGGVPKAGNPTAISLQGCLNGTGSWTATGPTETLSGPLAESPAGTYTGTYTAVSGGTYQIDTNIVCPDNSVEAGQTTITYIDPSGFVLDCSGNPLVGVPVVLFRSSDPAGPFTQVADGDTAVMDPAINTSNPTLTDSTGFYRWDVSAGYYRVEATYLGITVSSPVLPVPPEQLDVDLVFSTVNCATPVTPDPVTAGPAPTAPPPTAPAPTTQQSSEPLPTPTATPLVVANKIEYPEGGFTVAPEPPTGPFGFGTLNPVAASQTAGVGSGSGSLGLTLSFAATALLGFAAGSRSLRRRAELDIDRS